MNVMRAIAVLLFGLVCASASFGQENVAFAHTLLQADAIVVGTLRRDFRFPWLNGWNERGHVAVEQVIRGSVRAGVALPFAWERDFKQGWCLTRPDWREAVDKRGIWILSRDGDRYRAPLFFGFRDTKDLATIHEELRGQN